MERIPALHQRRTASQGAASLSVLRWCLLTGSFIRSFIPKYLWVPRPCQEGSGTGTPPIFMRFLSRALTLTQTDPSSIMGNSRWTRVPAITTPSVELDSSRARLTGPVVGGGPQRPSRTLSPEPWGSSSRTCVHKRVLHTDLWSLGHDPRGGSRTGQGDGNVITLTAVPFELLP